MGLYDVFFGTTQSQYAAYAILAAIFTICITILFSGTDMTIGNRLLVILFVILTLIPSIFLILFEITCMVTGGTKDKNWWCWLYAWIIAVFIIIYCLFVVIISLSSLFTYNSAMEKVAISENNNIMTPESSNQYARDLMVTNEPQVKENFYLENFYGGARNNAEQSNRKRRETFTGTTETDEQEGQPKAPIVAPEEMFYSDPTPETPKPETPKPETPKPETPKMEAPKVEATKAPKSKLEVAEEEDEEGFEAFSNFNYARY
jgi:hypothetical protein